MSTTTMNGHQRHQSAATQRWATISVRDFFEQIPWTGVAMSPPQATTEQAAGEPAAAHSLSLTLSVNDYFRLFPWDGKPHVAVPVAPLDMQPDEPEDDGITLDGFADLF